MILHIISKPLMMEADTGEALGLQLDFSEGALSFAWLHAAT